MLNNLEYAGKFKSVEDRTEDKGGDWHNKAIGHPDHPVLRAVVDYLSRSSQQSYCGHEAGQQW